MKPLAVRIELTKEIKLERSVLLSVGIKVLTTSWNQHLKLYLLNSYITENILNDLMQ